MKLSRRQVLASMSAVAAHGAVAPVMQAAAGFPRKDDFAIPAGTAYLNAAMIHPMPARKAGSGLHARSDR